MKREPGMGERYGLWYGQRPMNQLLLTFPDQGFADWQALHRLLATSFASMEGRIDPPSSMNRLTPALLAEKAKTEMLLTVTDGGPLIATAFVAPHPGWAYLSKVAVDASYRGRGLARQMIEAIAAHGRAAGWAYLELQTRVELTENHATFAALGFEKTGESAHRGYERPTSITMRKILGPSIAAA